MAVEEKSLEFQSSDKSTTQIVHDCVIQDDDDAALARAGKRSQLKREWGLWTISAFAITNLCTWEASGTLIGPAFVNGGPMTVVYSFIASGLGMFCVYASLAEMASMYPTAGAEYHWAAIFAPVGWEPFMSYMQGWVTTFAWQCLTGSAIFLVAGLVQGVAVLGQTTYEPERYQCFLMMILVAVFLFSVDIFGKRFLPSIMATTGIAHIIFFIAIIVPMLALSTKAPSAFVWKSFENNGGWSSDGISFCLGFLGPAFGLLGADGCVHMAEECHRPSVNIPRAIMVSLAVNATLAFAFIVVALYSISDVDSVLNTPTGFPIMEMFRQATGSTAAAIVMEICVIIVWLGSTACSITGSSRLVWAFARDGAIPFSKFFSHVDPKTQSPIRAFYVTFGITVIFSLIVIGSEVALNALTSLGVIGIFVSYILLISNFLFFRIRNAANITYGPWRLGVFGIPINIAALAFCIFLVIFVPFPSELPVTAPNMNYSGPILLFVLAVAGVNWVFNARKHFKGPIVEVGLEEVQHGVMVERHVD